MLSHSVVAGISAEIAGGSVTGAVAGALAAEIAAISLQSKLFEPSYAFCRLTTLSAAATSPFEAAIISLLFSKAKLESICSL